MEIKSQNKYVYVQQENQENAAVTVHLGIIMYMYMRRIGMLTKTRNKPETPKERLEERLEERLRKRAEIRLQSDSRKSVLLNEPDRLALLLIEAADKIEQLEQQVYALENVIGQMDDIIVRLENRLDGWCGSND
jgi:chromosome segregation ATPase